MSKTTIEVRAKQERGYRAIGQYFPPIEWTSVEVTEEQLAQMAQEPHQFIEYRMPGGEVLTTQNPAIGTVLGKQEPTGAVTLGADAVDPYAPSDGAAAVVVAGVTSNQKRR